MATWTFEWLNTSTFTTQVLPPPKKKQTRQHRRHRCPPSPVATSSGHDWAACYHAPSSRGTPPWAPPFGRSAAVSSSQGSRALSWTRNTWENGGWHQHCDTRDVVTWKMWTGRRCWLLVNDGKRTYRCANACEWWWEFNLYILILVKIRPQETQPFLGKATKTGRGIPMTRMHLLCWFGGDVDGAITA